MQEHIHLNIQATLQLREFNYVLHLKKTKNYFKPGNPIIAIVINT